MKYAIIFWGNSSDSKRVFTLKNKIVKIMMGPNLEIVVQVYLRD
jgi:hypothetical protein